MKTIFPVGSNVSFCTDATGFMVGGATGDGIILFFPHPSSAASGGVGIVMVIVAISQRPRLSQA